LSDHAGLADDPVAPAVLSAAQCPESLHNRLCRREYHSGNADRRELGVTAKGMAMTADHKKRAAATPTSNPG